MLYPLSYEGGSCRILGRKPRSRCDFESIDLPKVLIPEVGDVLVLLRTTSAAALATERRGLTEIAVALMRLVRSGDVGGGEATRVR
jgi:hypothetical protein